MKFIGYQGDLAICIAETREELENNEFMEFDKIEEVESALMVDGRILFGDEIVSSQKAQALATIDNETSQAILAGFDYEVEGESLHFSYDSFDQQNFADTANVCSLSLGGVQGLPQTVTWNAYREGGELVRLTFGVQDFLALYAGGALVHKAMQMEIGGQRKAQVEACETVDEIKALLGDWGL